MRRSSSPNISPQYQQEEDEEVDGFSPEQPFTLTVGYGSLTQRLNTKKEKDKDKRGGLPFLIQTPSCPAHSLLHTRVHTQRPFAGTVIFPSPESTLNTQQIGAAETCCMKSTNKSASRRCYCHSWSWLIRKAPIVTANPRDVKYYSNSGHILSRQRWTTERHHIWCIALEWITSKTNGSACKWTMSNYDHCVSCCPWLSVA